jgi:hypothetical protein
LIGFCFPGFRDFWFLGFRYFCGFQLLGICGFQLIDICVALVWLWFLGFLVSSFLNFLFWFVFSELFGSCGPGLYFVPGASGTNQHSKCGKKQRPGTRKLFLVLFASQEKTHTKDEQHTKANKDPPSNRSTKNRNMWPRGAAPCYFCAKNKGNDQKNNKHVKRDKIQHQITIAKGFLAQSAANIKHMTSSSCKMLQP